MDILCVGVGYVGLVTGACFAEMGHGVTCLDIDKDKINQIECGKIPFFEPELDKMVLRGIDSGRLKFTTSYCSLDSLFTPDVCIVAVPTPSTEDGTCDLKYLFSAVDAIANHLSTKTVIVIKSTVPVGTCSLVKERIFSTLQKRNMDIDFDVVSNPEFLKEGSAVQDCLKPDRIIIGTESAHAEQVMRRLYAGFHVKHDRMLVMDLRSSEMTKYAANSMLACRISFMNEISRICEATGADISKVRIGIGSDERIGYDFLYSGIGFGGSCFPKDLRALIGIANANEQNPQMLSATLNTNEEQKQLLGNKVIKYFSMHGGIEGKTVAIWGLSFKPETDDVREAPVQTTIKQLLKFGANLRLFDPVAMENTQKIFGDNPQITWCENEYEAAEGADAIALCTEWKRFRFPDFELIGETMRHKAMFDGRNQYKKEDLAPLGFDYFGIGVGDVFASNQNEKSSAEQRDFVGA